MEADQVAAGLSKEGGARMNNEQVKELAQSIANATLPMRDALECALACLRHTHDRLVDYPELETLRITINSECRAIKAALSYSTEA